MVYFWKKNGRIYHHAAETKEAAMRTAKQMDGLTGQPQVWASDDEFESGGCLARLIDGAIVIGRTEAEKQAGLNEKRVRVLKRLLSDTDYIAVKIAEGAATADHYADKLAQRQAWRTEIQELESA
ncbi:MAG: hypothetical protein LBB47_05510 [Spirochaetaceae bacterium]|jgi:hypothetical protein|nr:hypothetical protein [Spirochaetaceae bacterium]